MNPWALPTARWPDAPEEISSMQTWVIALSLSISTVAFAEAPVIKKPVAKGSAYRRRRAWSRSKATIRPPRERSGRMVTTSSGYGDDIDRHDGRVR